MLNTVAASKETENKAATKKEAAQTNADQIKNSDDGIDAREAAEQQMKQDEDDATEPIDPWYVAPKEVVKAAQEPTVPDVAPEVGGASRQQLRAM